MPCGMAHGVFNVNSASCSDVPSKEYILSLDNAKPTSEKFVIADLDPTTLFVQPQVTEWLKEQLAKFHDSNTYEPPRREDRPQ